MAKVTRSEKETPGRSAIPSTPNSPSESERDEDRLRLALPLTEDGTRVQWARVRESRKAQIRAIIQASPELLPAPLAAADPAAAAALNTTLAESALLLLTQLQTLAAMRLYNLPLDQVHPLFVYADTERKAIIGPLTRVLDKHLTSAVSKYGDELALGVTLLATAQPKFARAAALVQKPGRVVTFPQESQTGGAGTKRDDESSGDL